MKVTLTVLFTNLADGPGVSDISVLGVLLTGLQSIVEDEVALVINPVDSESFVRVIDELKHNSCFGMDRLEVLDLLGSLITLVDNSSVR